MRIETKNTIKNSMEACVTLFEGAMSRVAEIYKDEEVKDSVKIERAQKVAEDLRNGCAGWVEKLNAACQTAAAELTEANRRNSDGLLQDHEYQNRLLNEAAFIRRLPDTMTQEDVARRLCVFYGDDMAKSVLCGALEEESNRRNALGLKGFDVDLLLPDVYGVHAAMLEKIRVAVESKIINLGSAFLSGVGFYSESQNEQTLMYAKGIFEGVRQYINGLPETVKLSPKVGSIPAFANDPTDLNVYFSMYRTE